MMRCRRRRRIGLFVEPENDVEEQPRNEQADRNDDREQHPIVEKYNLTRNRRRGFLETDLPRLWIPIGTCRAWQQHRKRKALQQKARGKDHDATGG